MEWKPGDVALCVDDRWIVRGKMTQSSDIKLGKEYVVTDVMSHTPSRAGVALFGNNATVALKLLGATHTFSSEGSFHAARFVKQPPLVEEGEAETSQPIDEGVHA